MNTYAIIMLCMPFVFMLICMLALLILALPQRRTFK